MKLFRSGWWPGPKPDVSPNRVVCSDCQYHSAAVAGWQYDRCHHPDADFGSIIRNDQSPTCHDVRNSESQCGLKAMWFTEKRAGLVQKKQGKPQ